MDNKEAFIEYVLAFYGFNGVYDFCFSPAEVEAGYQALRRSYTDFYGDSLDRERVRDIVLAARESTTV